MLNVIMLSIIMLSAVAPLYSLLHVWYTGCHLFTIMCHRAPMLSFCMNVSINNGYVSFISLFSDVSYRIRYTSFSFGPNKLDHLITIGLKGFQVTNALAYWVHFVSFEKIQFCK
jgi:hypothetical protein